MQIEPAQSNAPGLPLSPDSPWLASLAGYSDLPFRLLCRENGAKVACTEMISVKGLGYQNRATWDLLATSSSDSPLVVQLFGADPDLFTRPARWIWQRGLAWIDINAGCPVRKVLKTGAGAALVEDPERLGRIVEAVTQSAPVKVGAKLRLPGQGQTSPLLRLRDRLFAAGASWLTLHPRTASQGYRGQAKWPALAKMVQDSPGPVLASGDLFNAFQAKDCLEQTGAAGVMFARGALNNPAVFAQLTRLVLAGRLDPSSGPTKGVGSMSAILRRHGQLYRRYEPSGRGLLKLRFFVQRYTKGLPGAKWLRLAILDCNDWEGFERLLDDWQRSYQKSE